MTHLSDKLAYERAMLVQPGIDGASARKALQAVQQTLAAVDPDAFNATNLRHVIQPHTKGPRASRNPFLVTLRVALTGSTEPADIYEVMELLGKESALRRIEHAIQQLMVVA